MTRTEKTFCEKCPTGPCKAGDKPARPVTDGKSPSVALDGRPQKSGQRRRPGKFGGSTWSTWFITDHY